MGRTAKVSENWARLRAVPQRWVAIPLLRWVRSRYAAVNAFGRSYHWTNQSGDTHLTEMRNSFMQIFSKNFKRREQRRRNPAQRQKDRSPVPKAELVEKRL